MEKWSHKSLEWIHKVREENYKKTKDKSISELLEITQQATDEVVKSLGLKTIGPKSEPSHSLVKDKPKK